MKWIDINSARGLEIDQPVFTKDAEGNFGYGRLIKEEKTIKGIVRTFETARFEPKIFLKQTDCGNKEEENPIGNYSKTTEQTNITHIAIPK